MTPPPGEAAGVVPASGLRSHPVNGQRPPTPPGNEQDELLANVRTRDFAPTSSLPMSQASRSGYARAPTLTEVDLGDRGLNPFADPPNTAYDPGESAMYSSRPVSRGEEVPPPMRDVRRAWGWER